MTFTDTLLDFVTTPITSSARAGSIVSLSTLDWAACGMAGAKEGGFADWVGQIGSGGDHGAFNGQTCAASDAALINGTLSHALDYDDTHFGHIGHPSVVILPAVITTVHDWNSLQAAALIGIEASIRIGLWFGRDHYERGFHQTATAGAFGATLGAAHGLGLSRDQTRHALGLCASMASGLKAQFGTTGKPLNAGFAARAGAEAAIWAADGMTGATDGLASFADAHGLTCDPTAANGLGRTWHTNTLSHKFHACCHGLHATLEALRYLPSGPDVEKVDVITHPRWMNVCNTAEPDTGLASKFSYRQVVAMMLNGIDTGDIASFSDANAIDPALIALRQKVSVSTDETLSEMQARVVVTAQGGRHEGRHDLADGYSKDELTDRVHDKVGKLIGAGRAEALITAARRRNLDGFKDIAFGANP